MNRETACWFGRQASHSTAVLVHRHGQAMSLHGQDCKFQIYNAPPECEIDVTSLFVSSFVERNLNRVTNTSDHQFITQLKSYKPLSKCALCIWIIYIKATVKRFFSQKSRWFESWTEMEAKWKTMPEADTDKQRSFAFVACNQIVLACLLAYSGIWLRDRCQTVISMSCLAIIRFNT